MKQKQKIMTLGMTSNRALMRFVIIVFSTLTLLLACDAIFAKKDTNPRITISGSYTVVRGQKITLTATVVGGSSTSQGITWRVVSGTDFATIDSNTGELEGTKEGIVDVVATSKEDPSVKSTGYTVIVKAPPVERVTISGAKEVAIWQMLTLTATVSGGSLTSQGVTWSLTTGTGTAAIYAGGELTGTKEGTVNVVATSKEDPSVKSAEYTVTVKALPLERVTIWGVKEIEVGQKAILLARVEGGNPTSQGVTWSLTAGTGTATIDSHTGKLEGIKEGTVNVVATSNENPSVKSAEYTVTVKARPVLRVTISGAKEVVKGQRITLTATVVGGSSTSEGVTWALTADTGTATIDPNTGELEGTKEGIAIVVATSKEDPSVRSSQYMVIVNAPVSSVTISGPTEVVKEQKITLTATVVGGSSTSQGVTWTVTAGAANVDTAVTNDGKLEVTGKVLEERATIMATSKEDPSKSASVSVAVSRYAGFILVAGGIFQMGSTDGDSDEEPVHDVTVSSFYMKKTEVTNEEYAVFLNAKGVASDGSFGGAEYLAMDANNVGITYGNGQFQVTDGYSNFPVVKVTWNGAKAYSEWLGGRLPTEAEWEYAARGGSNKSPYKYSGSNVVDEVAWYGLNSGGLTRPVGKKKANELGLHDMSGNVWEWCSDWYGAYSSESQDNPQGPTSGSLRVGRGGSWSSGASGTRVANRRRSSPGYSYSNVGFRVVLRTR